MGTRIKTFVSTGIAPDGRLFAGDLNAMEDQYADQMNLTQTLGVGVIYVGNIGLQLSAYNAGEARISGAWRADGIIRAGGGLFAGAYTTTGRDAIPLGFRPFGLIILNMTTNRLEINLGTDTTPSWSGLVATITRGLQASRPGAAASNTGNWYFATDDNGGTLSYSDGSVWTKVSKGITEPPVSHAASHLGGASDSLSWVTIHGSGLLASRPGVAAGNAGYIYFATDDNGGTLYRSTGSAWVKLTRGLTETLTGGMLPANTISLANMVALWPNPWVALMAAMVEGVLPAYGVTPQNALGISAGGGWNLNFAAGRVLVQGDDNAAQGTYIADYPAGGSLTLTSTAPANPRLDVIGIRVNDSAYTGRSPANAFEFVQVQGTPTVGATLVNRTGAPAISASVLWLADYLMVPGDANTTLARIGDQRKAAGPGIWGEDNHLYRLGVDGIGKFGAELVV